MSADYSEGYERTDTGEATVWSPPDVLPFALDDHDLRSRFGFGDGDLFWDFLYDRGYDPTYEIDPFTTLNHAVLIRCVRRHLVPLLPADAKVYEIGTIHNPIRCDDLIGSYSTIVEQTEVLAIAAEIDAEHAGMTRL